MDAHIALNQVSHLHHQKVIEDDLAQYLKFLLGSVTQGLTHMFIAKPNQVLFIIDHDCSGCDLYSSQHCWDCESYRVFAKVISGYEVEYNFQRDTFKVIPQTFDERGNKKDLKGIDGVYYLSFGEAERAIGKVKGEDNG